MPEEQKTAQNSGEVKSNSSLKDRLMENKFLLIVAALVILILIVAGFVSDQRMDLKDKFLWKGVAQDEGQAARDLEECRKELDSLADCADSKGVRDDQVSEGTGGQLLSVESSFGEYKIAFKYPERFVNAGRDFVSGGEGFGDFDMTEKYELLAEMRWDDTETASRIFVVTDYELMLSNGDSPLEGVDEYGVSEVEINGKKYPVQQFSIGDGYMGQSAMESNYIVKLEDDLYLSVVRMRDYEGTICRGDYLELDESFCTQDRCVDQEDCTDFEPETISEFMTPPEDIKDAFKIMESFTWEKAE